MRSSSPKTLAPTTRKRALASAAGLLLGALALTACQPSATAATGAGTAAPTASQQASGGGTSPGTSASPLSAPTGTGGSASGGSNGTNGSAGSTGGSAGTGTNGGGGSDNTDSYAWTHPCSASQITVHVVTRSAAPSQRVIEVRNLGPHACGLSYYPLVSLGDRNSADQSNDVKPLVPGGLGGPPAYPIHAGETAYAVIDLDPSGATSGTAPGIDELNVLADGDHMPNADTLNFSLATGTRVLSPKLGLYEQTISAAVSSMTQATSPSQ